MNHSTPIMTRKRSALAQLTDENVKTPVVPLKRRKKASQPGKENQSKKPPSVAKPKTASQEKPPAPQEIKEEVEVSESRGIQSLPDHAVEEIFLNLDRASMLQFAMTDKYFNRVFSDHKIMSTFKLTLNFDTEILPTADLTRRYQKVILKSFTAPKNYHRFFAMKRIFSRLGPHIKSLKFWNCAISDMWITRILRHSPHLEILKFKNCVITSSDDEEPPNKPLLKKFSLTKLKTLSICQTRYNNIVQLLEDVTTLKEVKVFAVPIVSPVAEQETEEIEHFKTIIARQKSLKKLCLTEETFFNVAFNDCEFQLDHLELSLFVLRNRQMDFIAEFLTTQTIIESCVFNVAEIADTNSFIPAMMYLLTLTTLKKLRLVLFTVKAMQAIYEQDFYNNSITELDFLPFQTDHAYKRVVEAVAKKFCNVRKLRFGLDDSWLDPESTSDRTFEPLNSMKLEHLTLENFNSRLVGKIAMPQLKSLRLVALNGSKQKHWNRYFANNPSIQHLALLDTCKLSKHSVIRLIESAVMNLANVATICACASFIDRDRLRILCGSRSCASATAKLCSNKNFSYTQLNFESLIFLEN